ncbi:hypothetical protein BCE75_11528 [Isoptericola sp. CG 20/1183]|uniref:Transmembrane protein n=1 Tax=Isoptericola halotolerans TaxID=300560 RepID=A0ABX5E9X2_9MICO|nr:MULTISPECIES: hypothetical protein [Isoptericola]PRZ03060.1 hypothetical protein BCE75_11528 [Isoptericola sp. CG 20/1183]PRZ03314.1 hypothetical protein BCL65_11428 [Isoptericola halotolerans]
MRPRALTATVRGAASTAAVAAVVTFVFLLQPWRTCPDDDAPAGCPALPQDAAVVMVAGTVALIALFVMVVAAVARRDAATSPPSTTSPRRTRLRAVALAAFAGLCAAVYGWGYLSGFSPY